MDGNGRHVEAWRERNMKEEREEEEPEEGKEIGSAILDQIREVWRVDEGRKGEGKSKRETEGSNER